MNFAQAYSKSRRFKEGLTLIELLVVIAIIAILTGMVMTVVYQSKRRAYVSKATAETRELTRAWHAYWVTYGKWPAGLENASDVPMNSANISHLLGGSGGDGVRLLDPGIKVSADGMRDPWGHFYIVDFSKTRFSAEDTYEGTVYFPQRKRYDYDAEQP